MSLFDDLNSLRPALALAAQSVIDDWQPDKDGFDLILGSGGACDNVSDAMSEVIYRQLDAVQVLDGGHDGDDHAWLIVVDEYDAAGVDIHPSVYETGGGYSWQKIDGARILPSDVAVFKLNRDDMEDRLERSSLEKVSSIASRVTKSSSTRTAYEGDDFRLAPGIGFHLMPDGRWAAEKIPEEIVKNARFSGYLTIQGYRCVVFEHGGEQWAQKSTGTIASKIERVAKRVAFDIS